MMQIDDLFKIPLYIYILDDKQTNMIQYLYIYYFVLYNR